MRVPSSILASVLMATGALTLLASQAAAQSAPPIKPGLWEVQMEREGGPKPPDMSAHLKNMPPEQRARMEAMMKERGVDMSGGMNKLKVCLDKDSLDQGRWHGEHDNHCQTDMHSSGTSKWTWHAVCGAPTHTVTDGEATFTNAENYVVKSTTTMTMQGQPQTIKSTIRSKWLSAQCGDIKPVQAMKAPLPQRPAPR